MHKVVVCYHLICLLLLLVFIGISIFINFRPKHRRPPS